MQTKLFAPSLAALSILASANAFAGDIYNGPVRAGVSIPVSVDREITFRALTVAIETCSVEAALEVAQQVEPGLDISTLSGNGQVSQFSDGEYSYRNVGGLKLPVIENTILDPERRVFFAIYQNAQDMTLRGGRAVNGYFVIDRTAFANSPSETSIRAPWPQFAFEEAVRDEGVDAFGRPINPVRVAKNLRIVKPAVASPNVVFENIASGRATKLTANVDRYVDCLLTEIAR